MLQFFYLYTKLAYFQYQFCSVLSLYKSNRMSACLCVCTEGSLTVRSIMFSNTVKVYKRYVGGGYLLPPMFKLARLNQRERCSLCCVNIIMLQMISKYDTLLKVNQKLFLCDVNIRRKSRSMWRHKNEGLSIAILGILFPTPPLLIPHFYDVRMFEGLSSSYTRKTKRQF